MPEKTPPMSTKRGKLTAGKARERVASLEESIAARQHRLDQLEARLERSESPDERLLTAKTRLERRLVLERDQLEKLQKLLSRDTTQPEESGEFFASEEIDDLHRSFEEVRQNLVQMQARIDSSELPRDLGTRMASFEERVARREEVDSELFSQVLALQNGLDQERQTVRRLSRRTREQDQSLDALREAVEDSVVATVDLAQRLEELEEALSESAESKQGQKIGPTDQLVSRAEMRALQELVEDTQRGLLELQKEVLLSLEQAEREREQLRAAQENFAQRQAEAASQAQAEARLLAEARQSLEQAQRRLAEHLEAVASQAEGATETARERPPSEAQSQPASALEDSLMPLLTPVLSPLLARLESLEKASVRERTSADPTELAVETDGPRPAVFAAGARPKRVALFGARPPAANESAGGAALSLAGHEPSVSRRK